MKRPDEEYFETGRMQAPNFFEMNNALVLTELLSQEEGDRYGALEVGIYVPNLDYPIDPLSVSGEVQLHGEELRIQKAMNLQPSRAIILIVLSTTSQPMIETLAKVAIGDQSRDFRGSLTLCPTK